MGHVKNIGQVKEYGICQIYEIDQKYGTSHNIRQVKKYEKIWDRPTYGTGKKILDK